MPGQYRSLKLLSLIFTLSTLVACSGVPPKNLGYGSTMDLMPCPASPNCKLVRFENPYGVNQGLSKLRASLESTYGDLITEKRVSPSHVYLHAEYTSTLFRFVDDVECMITDKDIIIRSASRLGYSDFGVNAKRVEAVISAFNTDLAY